VTFTLSVAVPLAPLSFGRGSFAYVWQSAHKKYAPTSVLVLLQVRHSSRITTSRHTNSIYRPPTQQKADDRLWKGLPQAGFASLLLHGRLLMNNADHSYPESDRLNSWPIPIWIVTTYIGWSISVRRGTATSIGPFLFESDRLINLVHSYLESDRHINWSTPGYGW